MENEMRYYLKLVEDSIEQGECKPKYIVTAVQLPTGAIELAVNTENILEKINYILEAYDEEMHLRTNNEIVMKQLMIV